GGRRQRRQRHCRQPQMTRPAVAPTRLPHSTSELLRGQVGDALDLETRHGNGDLMRVLDILGIAGPFKVLNPWELEDQEGRHLIRAGGYAAMPFGEAYPPLLDFVREYLVNNPPLGLPQQSLSEWRGALAANLVALLSSVAPSHA